MSELPLPSGSAGAPRSGSDRRTVVVAAALAGVLVLLVGFFLLSGGDEPEVTAAPAAAVATPNAPPGSTPGPSPAPALVSAADVIRNPFRALYVAPADAAAGAATTGTTGTTSTTAPTTSTPTTGTGGTTSAPGPVPVPSPIAPTPDPVPVTPTTSTQPPANPPTTTPPPAAVPYELTLEAVSAPKAHGPRIVTWTVDGTEQVVIRGQLFGPHGELHVLVIRMTPKGTVVVLQVGTAEPITVPIGKTITVG